jgi:hypothetical protein
VSDAIDHNKAFVRKNIRIPRRCPIAEQSHPDAVVCPRAPYTLRK